MIQCAPTQSYIHIQGTNHQQTEQCSIGLLLLLILMQQRGMLLVGRLKHKRNESDNVCVGLDNGRLTCEIVIYDFDGDLKSADSSVPITLP